MGRLRLARLSLAGVVVAASLALAGCGNSPYQATEAGKSILYLRLEEEPKSLDPTYSYYDYEGVVLDLIQTAFLQFHYLKRDPLVLEPAVGVEMPRREPYPYWEGTGANRKQRVGEIWTFRIKPGVRFQDDPCFPGGRG